MATEPTLIKPRTLTPAADVFATDAMIVDGGVTVNRATPVQVVNAGAPVASEAEALAGADNTKRMTALRVAQAIADAGLSTNIRQVADTAALAALDLTQWKAAVDASTGATYLFTAGNFSAEITASDPRYVAPDSDPTGASGAWVLAGSEPLEVPLEWFNPPLDGTSDISAHLQAALDFGETLASAAAPVVVRIPPDPVFRLADAVEVPNHVKIFGRPGQLGKLWPHSSLPLSTNMIVNKNQPSGGVRLAEGQEIRWIDFDGDAREYPVWLTHTAPHPDAGDPVTDPGADYSSPGVIDIAQYPGGTIADVVAAGRRNAAAASTAGTLVTFTGVQGAVVSDCKFRRHGRFSVVFAGCKDHVARNNLFEECGAIDTASNMILDGNFGSQRFITAISKTNPCVVSLDTAPSFTAGQQFTIRGVAGMTQIADGTYTATSITGLDVTLADAGGTPIDSTAYGTFIFNAFAWSLNTGTILGENSLIEDNEFRDNHRIPIQHTGVGGTICRNRSHGSKEGGLFLIRVIGATVTDNELNDVIISDLVANSIEGNLVAHSVIRNNRSNRPDGHHIGIVGGFENDIDDNVGFRHASRGAVLRPYGIFSERYSFGSPPGVAGIALPAEDRCPFRLQAFGLFPVTGSFSRNTGRDDRGSAQMNYALRLAAAGTGSAGQVKNLTVVGNDFRTIPTADRSVLIDFDGTAVDVATVTTRDNIGYGSLSWPYLADADGRTLKPQESGMVFSNLTATAKAVFNLPTAVTGMEFTFVVLDADGIDVVAASGAVIRIGTATTSTARTATATDLGSTLKLRATGATAWVAEGEPVGTWTLT